ncbi:Crp/Fnr family transcriptional regulator [Actinocrispum wychmicini]|uniref:CRP-like cAMP-binding protein n=1 Tax=Actinocrispum wychmicini TaxID=1213861 RepID=A0A4R2JSS9_9PSEU|nr:Crp/Fnr family transcriptional regulator [Actinocrispum wychmicini]TCO62674.1 CRP-like cAMP-binding protein [Actinocrispum wychmicini]
MCTRRLSDEGQRKLIAAGTPRRWAPGQILIREYDTTDHVVLIISGKVKISSAASSGRQVMLALRGPGDLLGETAAIDGDARSATVTALTDVEAVTLTAPDFLRFLTTTPSVAVELLKIVLSRLRESTRRRLEGGAYDVPTRTALLLLDYALEYGDENNGTITVRMRQVDLADAAGASREAVAKALRIFRDAGAVRTNRGRFEVLRMDVLRRYAEALT